MSEQDTTTTATVSAVVQDPNYWLTGLFALGPDGIVVAGTDIRVNGKMAARIEGMLSYARATGEEIVKPRDWDAYARWADEAVEKRNLGRELLALRSELRALRDSQVVFMDGLRSDLRKFAELYEVPLKGLNKFLVDHDVEPFPVKIRGKVLLYAEPLEVEIEDLDFDGDPSDEDAVHEALIEAAHTLYSNDETDPFNYDDGQSEVDEFEVVEK
jgi:hypothetical protein